jgi:23S rRNA maturation mini-RNase III
MRLLPDPVDPRTLSPQALAFVGDGVYSLLVMFLLK